MEQGKPIFIDREPQTGDYVMRMPEEALAAFYDMLQAAPITSQQWFHQVKQHIEDNYREELARAQAEERDVLDRIREF